MFFDGREGGSFRMSHGLGAGGRTDTSNKRSVRCFLFIFTVGKTASIQCELPM